MLCVPSLPNLLSIRLKIVESGKLPTSGKQMGCTVRWKVQGQPSRFWYEARVEIFRIFTGGLRAKVDVKRDEEKFIPVPIYRLLEPFLYLFSSFSGGCDSRLETKQLRRNLIIPFTHVKRLFHSHETRLVILDNLFYFSILSSLRSALQL